MAFAGTRFRHEVSLSDTHGNLWRDGRSLFKQWSQGFICELGCNAFRDLGSQIKVFLNGRIG
jgi:hypothetical protein